MKIATAALSAALVLSFGTASAKLAATTLLIIAPNSGPKTADAGIEFGNDLVQELGHYTSLTTLLFDPLSPAMKTAVRKHRLSADEVRDPEAFGSATRIGAAYGANDVISGSLDPSHTLPDGTVVPPRLTLLLGDVATSNLSLLNTPADDSAAPSVADLAHRAAIEIAHRLGLVSNVLAPITTSPPTLNPAPTTPTVTPTPPHPAVTPTPASPTVTPTPIHSITPAPVTAPTVTSTPTPPTRPNLVQPSPPATGVGRQAENPPSSGHLPLPAPPSPTPTTTQASPPTVLPTTGAGSPLPSPAPNTEHRTPNTALPPPIPNTQHPTPALTVPGGLPDLRPSAAERLAAQAHWQKAKGWIDSGERGRAEREMVAAMQIRPDNGTYKAGLARMLLEDNRVASAVALYQDAITAAPFDANIRAGLAEALAKRGDTALALDAFKEAVQLDPNQPAIHWKLGEMLLHTGDAEHAIPELEKGNGGDPAAALALADAYAAAGNNVKSETTLQAALKTSPKENGLRSRLASIQLKEGKAGAAISTLLDILHHGGALDGASTTIGGRAIGMELVSILTQLPDAPTDDLSLLKSRAAAMSQLLDALPLPQEEARRQAVWSTAASDVLEAIEDLQHPGGAGNAVVLQAHARQLLGIKTAAAPSTNGKAAPDSKAAPDPAPPPADPSGAPAGSTPPENHAAP